MEKNVTNMEKWEKEAVFECLSTGELQLFCKGHLISKCNTGIKCCKLPEKVGFQSVFDFKSRQRMCHVCYLSI